MFYGCRRLLVTGTWRCEHIAPVLRDLHRLPAVLALRGRAFERSHHIKIEGTREISLRSDFFKFLGHVTLTTPPFS